LINRTRKILQVFALQGHRKRHSNLILIGTIRPESSRQPGTIRPGWSAGFSLIPIQPGDRVDRDRYQVRWIHSPVRIGARCAGFQTLPVGSQKPFYVQAWRVAATSALEEHQRSRSHPLPGPRAVMSCLYFVAAAKPPGLLLATSRFTGRFLASPALSRSAVHRFGLANGSGRSKRKARPSTACFLQPQLTPSDNYRALLRQSKLSYLLHKRTAKDQASNASIWLAIASPWVRSWHISLKSLR
jgi:hypothetical protein